MTAWWNRGAIRLYYNTAYTFGDSGTNNNGNLYRSEHFVPLDASVSDWAIFRDTYSYDAVSRVTQVEETGEKYISGNYTADSDFTQVFDYDRYGNRTINQTSTTGSVNKANYGVDAATNRLTIPSGQSGTYTYDAAGNLLYDSRTSDTNTNRTFDAENRLLTSSDGGVTTENRYDSGLKRVRQKIGSGELWFIYGFGGELLAEYAANASSTNPTREYAIKDGKVIVQGEGAALKWYVVDQLGSTRMIVDKDGSLTYMERKDYLPFGEELLAGVGERTTGMGYASSSYDKSRPARFTGQFRDSDTTFDYFGARYNFSKVGRFLSVDPAESSIEPIDPQSLNRYAYVMNRPLIGVDPDGAQVAPKQAGTMHQVLAQLSSFLERKGLSKAPATVQMQAIYETYAADNTAELPLRYVYTKGMGWIDLKHFFGAATAYTDFGSGQGERAASALVTIISAVGNVWLGDQLEDIQWFQGYVIEPIKNAKVYWSKGGVIFVPGMAAGINARKSAHSPEDPRSNFAGANFSLYLLQRRHEWMVALMDYIDALQAADPEEAPDWKAIGGEPPRTKDEKGKPDKSRPKLLPKGGSSKNKGH